MPTTSRRSPTLHDVAARAGVSHTTVSRVLHGSNLVAPATAGRVETAIRDLDYVLNTSAQALAYRRQIDGIGRAVMERRTSLGIELGSTRIKAVLIGPDHQPIATAGHSWENQYIDGVWTYSLDAVWDGLRRCFTALAEDVRARYGTQLTGVGALGVSAMMHGYLAFDDAGELLVPFRTWRNTNTSNAAHRLSAAFDYNIPHRWSVAHLYQALIDSESHVNRIAYLTTLAGYVHWQLSGEKLLGVGDASGMFPIDVTAGGYDRAMLATFDDLATPCGLPTPLIDLLPRIRSAGQPAGRLTETGALLLDPTGTLAPGAPLCPPEGDAGTGMVATNSVAPGTGNVSAGTSIFAMVVLRTKLQQTHPELDLVTTPSGDLAAMVHCNNGASELDTWALVFTEFTAALGLTVDKPTVFDTLVRSSLDGEPDCGGLVAFNYLSGEPITGLHEGRPLILRTPQSRLTLANFMRSQLYTALVTLRIGMDILQKEEHVHVDRMFAHGGLFTTKGVAQRFLAAAINTPVCVGDTATEGGAWGIAILAAFLLHQPHTQTLPEFLDHAVFTATKLHSLNPTPADVNGFNTYAARFVAALPIEQAAPTTTQADNHRRRFRRSTRRTKRAPRLREEPRRSGSTTPAHTPIPNRRDLDLGRRLPPTAVPVTGSRNGRLELI